MRRLRLWTTLLLTLTAAAPATAQVAGHPFEISGQAGLFSPDARTRVQTGPAFGGSFGWRWQSWLVLEGQGLYAPSKADTAGEPAAKFAMAGLDLRFNLRPGENQVVPYLLGGLGYARSSVAGQTTLERGAPSIGAGALFNLFGNPRWAARVQVRDVFFRDRDATEFSNHVGAMIGVHYTMGGRSKDVDLDGVRDWLDEGPATPIGAKVDARGRPLDSDGDGVFDGLDKCDGTPRGAKVDKTGCPLDGDADGVPDGIDTCPDTPAGARVNATGCPGDADADSVYDGIDQCPDTPAGARVDAKGCPVDTDGDGVPDGIDQCANTPGGAKVDAKGCVAEAAQREAEMLDTGMMRFNTITFAADQATLLPEASAALDVAGQVLTQWPQLRIEIAAHTDQRGTDARNQKLSVDRAKAVQAYLLEKFPTLDGSRLTPRGYGESRPLAPGGDDASMALNRRVEFVVLNKDVLKSEVEKRRTEANPGK